MSVIPFPTSITKHEQKGVALLIVLLLVVSITIVAGSMLASQKITIRKSALLFEQNQINNTLEVGKYSAIELIDMDEKSNDFDSNEDVWAKTIPPQTTAEGYSIDIAIYDASSKFNINNLYHHGSVDEQSFLVFQRLLESLNLDPALAKTVLDWQDPDSEVYQDGGDESAIYQTGNELNTTQTVANQPFISINQLLELPNVTSDIVMTLKPYITAVPYWLPLNANTVSEKVLSALFLEGSQDVGQLLNQQGSLNSTEALEQLELFNQIEDEQQKLTLLKALDVSSQAFEVLVSVSNVEDTKHRYATMMVTKKKELDANKESSQPENGVKSASADVPFENKKFSVYNYRIWAFRPNLFYSN